MSDSGESKRAKNVARSVLGNAVRAGRIERPGTCDRCEGGGPIEAHHHDYTKPLDVEWVCKPCHTKIHHGPLEKCTRRNMYMDNEMWDALQELGDRTHKSVSQLVREAISEALP